MHRRRQLVAAETVNRQWYLDEAEQCSWVENIEIWRTDKLDSQSLAGYIIRHGPALVHGLVHNYMIVVAKGLDLDFERFVCIKELMHCFFPTNDGTSTDSELLLESHIRQMFGKSTEVRSAHVVAERTALWMALGVITPERVRRALLGDKAQTVAERLNVPVGAAKLLISKQADIELPKLIN